MAAEPEKKIEESLHAYARKRREEAGAPMEMHPATRRLLQSEVQKQIKSGAGEPERRWWQSLLLMWPRFAAGLTVFAILGTGVWVIVQSERQDRAGLVELRDAKGEDRAASAPSEAKRDLTEVETTDPAKRDSLRKNNESLREDDGLAPDQKTKSGIRDMQAAERPAPTTPPEREMARAPAREKQVLVQYDAPAPVAEPTQLAGGAIPPSGAAASAPVQLYRKLQLGAPQDTQPAKNQLADKATLATTEATPALNAASANKLADAYYFADSDLSTGKTLNGVLGPMTNLLAFGKEPALPAQAPVSTSTVAANGRAYGAGAVVAQSEVKLMQEQEAAKKESLVRARSAQPESQLRLETAATRFVREDASAPAVLGRFELERTGSTVRLRDGDGSVYEGNLLTTLDDVRASKDESRADRQPVASRPASTNGFAFTARGTNARLRQLVVVTGEVLHEETLGQRADPLTLADTGNKVLSRPQPAPAAPIVTESLATNSSRRVIRGQVRIGPTNVTNLRAVSAPR